MKHVDDVVEAIFHRLCINQKHGGADKGMSLVELRLAPGVTKASLNEGLWVLTFPGEERNVYPTQGRVALGPGWRERCERQSESKY